MNSIIMLKTSKSWLTGKFLLVKSDSTAVKKTSIVSNCNLVRNRNQLLSKNNCFFFYHDHFLVLHVLKNVSSGHWRNLPYFPYNKHVWTTCTTNISLYLLVTWSTTLIIPRKLSRHHQSKFAWWSSSPRTILQIFYLLRILISNSMKNFYMFWKTWVFSIFI